MAGQGNRAAVQKVDGAGVAQQQAVDPEEFLVAFAARGYARAQRGGDRHGGREHGVHAAQGQPHAPDPVGASTLQVDVFAGFHVGATLDPGQHARVVARAIACDQFAVPCVALGRTEAAAGVQAGQFVHGRQIDLGDAGSSRRQGLQAAFESAGDRGFHPVLKVAFADPQPVILQGAVADRYLRGGQDFVREDGVAHAACHGADGVQCGRQRQDALRWGGPGCVLEADDAVEGGRHPDGATGVRAQSDEGGARGDRHGGARAGTARHMAPCWRPGLADSAVVAAIPGAGCAVVRVVAHARKGKFDHVGAADQAGARCPQSGHRRAVPGGRWSVGQHHRAGRGDLSLHVKQVLDRYAQAGQWALGDARRAGCLAQAVRGQLHKDMRAGRAACHVQAALGLLGGAGLAVLDGLARGVQVGLGHGAGAGWSVREIPGAIILRLCGVVP